MRLSGVYLKSPMPVRTMVGIVGCRDLGRGRCGDAGLCPAGGVSGRLPYSINNSQACPLAGRALRFYTQAIGITSARDVAVKIYLLVYHLKSVAARSGGLLIKAFPPDRAAYTYNYIQT